MERFAKVGVFPPPLAGDDHDPESVQFHLAAQERWLGPPSLLGSDEEGVERQMADFLVQVGLGLKRYDALRDPSEFGSWDLDARSRTYPDDPGGLRARVAEDP